MPTSFIVSLTTIPTRFEGLSNLAWHLAKQSVQPIAYEINIPTTYRNPDFNNFDTSQIPNLFNVKPIETDWGPGSKIIPTVERYMDEDIPIIYIDDDRLYDCHLFSRLLRESELAPNACIAASTVSVTRQLEEAYWRTKPTLYRTLRLASCGLWNPKRQQDRSPLRIAEGYAGVLVKPRFFDRSLFEYPEHLRNVDDVWISACMTKNGVPIKKCEMFSHQMNWPSEINQEDIGRRNALLHTISNGLDRSALNAACIKYVQEQFGIWST